MDFVRGLHRVFGIGEALGFVGALDFAREPHRPDQGVVGFVAVVDYLRSLGDHFAVAGDGPRGARLPDAAHPQNAGFAVRRGQRAELVPRKPAEPLAAPGFGLRAPFREIRFVDPNVAGKRNAFLYPLDYGEDLRKPISPGGIGVPVVQ